MPEIKHSKGNPTKKWTYATVSPTAGMTDANSHSYDGGIGSGQTKRSVESEKALPTIREAPHSRQKYKPKANVVIVSSVAAIDRKSPTKFPKLAEGSEEEDESLFSHDIGSTPFPGSKEKEDEESILDLDMSFNIGPTRSQRRDMNFLKKNPGMMFPKMNEIIVKNQVGENEPIDLEAERMLEDRGKSIYGRQSLANIHLAKDYQQKNESKPVTCSKAKSLDIEQEPVDYVKLIQKLTTYLPDHLAETAKHQVRKVPSV